MSQALLLLHPQRVAAGERERRIDQLRAISHAGPAASSGEITVRVLGEADRQTLRRLAGRDSAIAPEGRMIGAEIDGTLVAALSLSDGRVIADPFRPTSSAIELLRLRARQLGATPPSLLSRLRHREAVPRAHGALAGSPPGGTLEL